MKTTKYIFKFLISVFQYNGADQYLMEAESFHGAVERFEKEFPGEDIESCQFLGGTIPPVEEGYRDPSGEWHDPVYEPGPIIKL